MPKPATKPTFERYGLQWERSQVNDLSLELACFSAPKMFVTGKPREFHFRNAWKIVWPQYEWNEWAEMIAWAWCNYRIVTVIGHTSSTKSHTTAHALLLDYLAAPPLTSTTVTTTKFDALRSRIWGDIMKAIETSAMRSALLDIFKVTTTSNELKIGMMKTEDNLSADKYLIQGVATDSADDAGSKIRGQHTERRRIVADECEDMGEALYSAIDNARVDDDFIAFLLTNPADRSSAFNQKWSCPKNGWGSVSPMDLWWPTVQPDGICLHFDGLQSPNIKAKKTVFPYMLTQKYVDDLRETEGENSLKWWMFVRGFPAPDGVIAKIWPEASLAAAKKQVEFDFDPIPCAALDPAFDSDDCVIHFGEIGRIRGDKQCCRVKETIKLQMPEDPRIVPKDYQVAKQVKALCIARGVKPENFIMDETGNARGVLAILRVDWSQKVQGIYYGGEATNRPLRPDDVKPANEQVKYFVAELWFRASYLAQAGLLVGLQNCDKKTTEDLAARRYELKQFGNVKLMVAEPKVEMKKRLSRSPDYGDAFCQFGELMARQGMLTAAGSAAPKKIWEASRKLAQRAARRYAEPQLTH